MSIKKTLLLSLITLITFFTSFILLINDIMGNMNKLFVSHFTEKKIKSGIQLLESKDFDTISFEDLGLDEITLAAIDGAIRAGVLNDTSVSSEPS